MDRFFVGVIVGIVIATIGVSGMAKVLDKGVETVKEHSREMAK